MKMSHSVPATLYSVTSSLLAFFPPSYTNPYSFRPSFIHALLSVRVRVYHKPPTAMHFFTVILYTLYL